jgi:hypothetical protein
MPPLDGSPSYLIDYLFEIGPAMDGGMGIVPLSYGEIAAWSLLTGIRLRPWEARTLRRLSREYVDELHKGSWRPPWQSPDEKPQPTEEQLAIRALANL